MQFFGKKELQYSGTWAFKHSFLVGLIRVKHSCVQLVLNSFRHLKCILKLQENLQTVTYPFPMRTHRCRVKSSPQTYRFVLTCISRAVWLSLGGKPKDHRLIQTLSIYTFMSNPSLTLCNFRFSGIAESPGVPRLLDIAYTLGTSAFVRVSQRTSDAQEALRCCKQGRREI